jgi:hypothetical protein
LGGSLLFFTTKAKQPRMIMSWDPSLSSFFIIEEKTTEHNNEPRGSLSSYVAKEKQPRMTTNRDLHSLSSSTTKEKNTKR